MSRALRFFALVCAALASACVSRELARTDDLVVIKIGARATPEKLAKKFLGDPDAAWRLVDFNAAEDLRPGGVAVAPLKDWRPTGVRPGEYQVVPVLTYHRFAFAGPCEGMTVCAADFAAQIDYLKREGYRIVPLADLAAFLEGERQLPQKAVVVTIDDGWKSTIEIAEPILAARRVQATLFLYTDFVGASSAIDWNEAERLKEGGVIDVQSHSKTHSDLTKRKASENHAAYSARLERELTVPARAISAKLNEAPFAFAYPYGATDRTISSAAEEAGYRIAATVVRGPNPAFAHPFVLKRTMIYGEDDLDTFARRLDHAVSMEQ